jgi:hypothetical protein
MTTKRQRGGLEVEDSKCNPATLPVVTVTGVGSEALRPQLPLRMPMQAVYLVKQVQYRIDLY